MTVGSGEEEGTKTVKKHREKEEQLTKIVLRRLPPGIGPEELRALFAPLPPGEPHAFWFCAAPGAAGDAQNSADDVTVTVAEAADDEVAATLRRARCAFARAYVVFREEQNALSFAERFNGYVFVDKNGTESMAIAELALNQTMPKHSMEMAKQCDERVDTLANDVSFLKLMRRREAALATVADGGVRRVTDFDELVRELEEKRRRLGEGQVQETPLTEFIRRMALEKARKPRRRSALAASELPAAEQSAKEAPTTKSIKGRAGKTTAVAEGEEGKAATASKKVTRRERRRRKEQKAKADEERKKVVDDEGKASEAKSAAISIKFVKRDDVATARQQRRRRMMPKGAAPPLAPLLRRRRRTMAKTRNCLGAHQQQRRVKRRCQSKRPSVIRIAPSGKSIGPGNGRWCMQRMLLLRQSRAKLLSRRLIRQGNEAA